MEREELLNKAIERLKSMIFENNFYEIIYKKTNNEKYKIRIERLQADIKELQKEIELFKGGE